MPLFKPTPLRLYIPKSIFNFHRYSTQSKRQEAQAVAKPSAKSSVQDLYEEFPIYSYKPFAHKTAIITGASRGIGLAIAKRFALGQASCILLGRKEETLRDAVKTLWCDDEDLDQGEHVHSYRVGDVGDRKFWIGLSKDNEMKKASILINAAGITHSSLLVTTKPELVDSIIQTNLMGAIWASQIMTKIFLKRKEGQIINISSLLATKGGIGSTAYAASKAGIIGLTRSLAAEVGGSGIRVNAILPGYIKTDMTDAMDTKAHDQALQSIPLKRFGTPEEVAHAAFFLATNPYATNCVLNLDGGLSAT